MRACSWLADRAFGKPVAVVDATLSAEVDVGASGCPACAEHERVREAIREHLTDEDVDRVDRALLGPD